MCIRDSTVIIGIVAVITGGVLSLYASSNPDGLEWSMEKTAGTSELKNSDKTHSCLLYTSRCV